MLDFLIYPVSGVMKLWHLLLHNLIGLDDSIAWFISLFGLVITVRAIIAPFTWKMYKSGRLNAQIRPRRAAIEKEFEGRHDQESIRTMQQKQRDLNKEFGINPLAGCVPMLIQLPTVIGLYQVLLRMARPEGGLDNPTIHPIGFLSAEEVQTFLEGKVANVPLPAYVAMPTEQLAFLGTTRGDVLSFVLPLFIIAAVFTAFNMALSTYRNFQTNDYASGFSTGMLKTFIWLAVLAPIFPLLLGLTGPFPTAIALYWVTNNLWTFGQTAIMHFVIEHKYPLTEEFKEHHRVLRDIYREGQKEKRSFLWTRRKNCLMMVLTPHKASELHAENVAMTEERTSRLEAEKAEKKDLKAKRRESRRKINQETMTKMKERRKANKAKRQAGGKTPGETSGEAAPEITEDTGKDSAESTSGDTLTDHPGTEKA
ncbi:membrane protein insertase YidC [uncultured Corynebacterium sp.]|uniref:membrane protein insertase YidC n=1 Tax=uncultured Corynebacterium sp. TaxID=159447 RepID=UPI0025E7CA26|nr:membrane protein insertase YidC [uncultured Corynebacterium sp.]